MATVTRTTLEQRWADLLAGRGEVAHPYELYADLRREAPVFEYEGVLVLTRHEDVKAVFRDAKRFPPPLGRLTVYADSFSLLSEEELGLYHEIIDFERLFIARQRGEAHRRYRGAMHRAFTPRRIAEMRGAVERIVDDMLAETVEGCDEVDLLEFCYRVPLLVITQLLGAPAEDAERIKHWGDTVLGSLMVSPIEPAPLREGYENLREYRAYAAELVERNRRADDPSGLVALLLDAEQGDTLSVEELVATFLHLLFAGHETTTHLICSGMFHLLRERSEWERICADPGLIPGAVEEALRYDSIVQMTPRVCAEDDEFRGVRARKDSTLLLVEGAANRDPAVFPDPGRFDVTRKANDHMSLGHGQYFCLGASLARMEAQLAFGELSRRYPDMELAIGPDEAEWGTRPRLRGLKSLPVRMGAPAIHAGAETTD